MTRFATRWEDSRAATRSAALLSRAARIAGGVCLPVASAVANVVPLEMGAPTIDDVASAIVGFLNAEIMAAGHAVSADDGLAAAGVDSMALLKILLFIERMYGFWIPDEDLVAENVATCRSIARYVAARLGAA